MRKRSVHRHRRGVTLLELSIAVIISGILVAFVVPGFSRVNEQNKVDAAAQYLRSIWSAQRVYWLEKRTFTADLTELRDMGLIDTRIAGGNDGFFLYSVDSVSDITFTITATRDGSSVWSGTMTIVETGDLTGSVTGSGGVVLSPPDI